MCAMSIRSIFFDELVPLCTAATVKVDISILERVSLLSPVKMSLKFSDLEKDISGIDEIIIQNFASNFAAVGNFNRSAISAMGKILSRTDGCDETVAQKIFMLHASKADENADGITIFFIKCAQMKITQVLDDDLIKWSTTASKVFKNRFVNQVIERCAKEYGVDMLEDSSDDICNIVYVSYDSPRIRGFAGVNKIYINERHFKLTKFFYTDALDLEKLDCLMTIDVLNCVIHEYGHLKLRKAIDDINISSPILARLNNLNENYYEFGRYVETAIFGKPIDWAESAAVLPMEYLQSVIESIKINGDIPRFENLDALAARTGIMLMALDSAANKTMC